MTSLRLDIHSHVMLLFIENMAYQLFPRIHLGKYPSSQNRFSGEMSSPANLP